MATFDEAMHALELCQRPHFEAAAETLRLMGKAVAVCAAYREIFAEEAPAKLPKTMPTSLRSLTTLEQPGTQIVEALGGLFPISEMYLEEPEFSSIEIEEQNYSMNWDQFSEFVDNPEEHRYGDDGFKFCMMLWCRGNGIKRETWSRISNALGINVEYNKRFMTGRPFEWDKLKEKLEDAGLACFTTATEMAWKDTGNYFMDFDQEEAWETGDLPEWTTESIVHLAEEWKKADPILEAWREACTMLSYDNSLYQRIIDIMTDSLSEREAVGTDEDGDDADDD